MAFRILGLHRKIKTNQVPSLMDTHSSNEHVIDIASSSDAASSSSSHDRLTGEVDEQHGEFQPYTSSRLPADHPPLLPVELNSRNTSLVRRGNSRGRQRTPLINTGLWISVELLLTVSQIIAAVVVLFLSENEKPHAPLRTWIVGYASGCSAILPLLYWRFKQRNLGSQHDTSRLRTDSSQGNSNTATLSASAVEVEDVRATGTAARGTQINGSPNPRIMAFVEYFKMALDCFFAVWFVVGNVWIFGGHTSSAEASNLYRLCLVFLAFSCIGYALPFILCTTLCCCLPCILSVIGSREYSQNRGATQESINALPIYKFKQKKNKSSSDKENREGADGGIVAAGTEKERVITGEDAVCCICLSKYANNVELRELPCSHLFHRECVDKWLKLNSSCPLCKAEVGETLSNSVAEATGNVQNGPGL